jgi:hypothetical protein
MTILLVALFLAHKLGPELTYANNVNPASVEASDPQTIDQTDDELLANCRYGATTGPSTSWILPEIGAGIF